MKRFTDTHSREYAAALDLSGREAGFALVDCEQQDVAIKAFCPVSGRGSPNLLSWLEELLDQKDVELSQIIRWTVGSGPGSFTGMRMAAALVGGLTYGKNIAVRCVPTALALAAVVKMATRTRVAALFDGRNREILVYSMEYQDGIVVPVGHEEVLNAEKAEAYFPYAGFDHYVAFAYDLPSIKKIVPPEIVSTIIAVDHLPVEYLAFYQGKKYDNDLTALEYIRPAVYPKQTGRQRQERIPVFSKVASGPSKIFQRFNK